MAGGVGGSSVVKLQLPTPLNPLFENKEGKYSNIEIPIQGLSDYNDFMSS
jgi:hypothetical protein